MIGKGKPFTLLKDLISNKKEHLLDNFAPLVPNIFALSDSEDSTENEDEDELPNVALLKLIESSGEYLRKIVDGTSKDVVFSESVKALKVLPSKKIEQIASEELNMTEKSRKEYGELYFYRSKLMFGPLTVECEEVLKSYSFKRKAKEPYPIKINRKVITNDMFLSNILTVDAIIECEMLRDNMSCKQVTRNVYLDILPTTYHEELYGQGNFFNFLIKVFSNFLLSCFFFNLISN